MNAPNPFSKFFPLRVFAPSREPRAEHDQILAPLAPLREDDHPILAPLSPLRRECDQTLAPLAPLRGEGLGVRGLLAEPRRKP